MEIFYLAGWDCYTVHSRSSTNDPSAEYRATASGIAARRGLFRPNDVRPAVRRKKGAPTRAAKRTDRGDTWAAPSADASSAATIVQCLDFYCFSSGSGGVDAPPAKADGRSSARRLGQPVVRWPASAGLRGAANWPLRQLPLPRRKRPAGSSLYALESPRLVIVRTL